MKTDYKLPYKLCVCALKPTITNMATFRIFEFMSENFNVVNNNIMS